MSVVSLPMYDLPELRHVTNSWWTFIAGHLRAVGLSAVPALLGGPETSSPTGEDQTWYSASLVAIRW